MNTTNFDTLIVGAGISGISAAHYMQADCPSKTYAILEGRTNIGGTWDLFRYPGIRSDSDMYTFGFAFSPWIADKSIAPRELIIEYLEDTIKEEGIDKNILFEHKVINASWSTEDSKWSLAISTPQSEEPIIYTSSFLSLCTGYYDYKSGFTPNFPGNDKFKGLIVHPQHWPESLEVKDKNIVVIGSGATAVTIVPSLAAGEAAHVTMLQRSPTYIVSLPAIDKMSKWINKFFPKMLAYNINRWRNIMYQRLSYAVSRKYPNFMKKLIKKGVEKELGRGYDINSHFSPNYEPWDERLCVVPDSDLFNSIKSQKASIKTDHIETFTEDGIDLKSGEHLEADIIVTATGLNAIVVSNFDISVDGNVIDFSKHIAYKGSMFSDIPNMVYAFGYTNSSWTLKIDMVSQFFCRLINHMDKNGYKQACPRQNDPTLELTPFLDFSPGYVLRIVDKLPSLGSKKPWKLEQNYFYDKKILIKGAIEDGVIEFS
jgi:cation diffusion facilitator CzcD-associated flavoprotein CzcO